MMLSFTKLTVIVFGALSVVAAPVDTVAVPPEISTSSITNRDGQPADGTLHQLHSLPDILAILHVKVDKLLPQIDVAIQTVPIVPNVITPLIQELNVVLVDVNNALSDSDGDPSVAETTLDGNVQISSQELTKTVVKTVKDIKIRLDSIADQADDTVNSLVVTVRSSLSRLIFKVDSLTIGILPLLASLAGWAGSVSSFFASVATS